jgi:hypothetical protein
MKRCLMACAVYNYATRALYNYVLGGGSNTVVQGR